MPSGDRSLYLWSEPGEGKTVRVATVVPLLPIDRTYSFALRDSQLERIKLGQRVRAAFGKQRRMTPGFVVDISDREWDNSLRYLDSIEETESWLGPDLIELGRWLASYYSSPLGKTLSAMVPAAAKQQSGYRSVQYLWLASNREDLLKTQRLGPKQKALLEMLPSDGAAVRAELARETAQVSLATIRTAIKHGWIGSRVAKEPMAAPNFDEPNEEPTFALNESQQQACESVAAVLKDREFRAILLYGVSGSGKTEVYIDAMKRVVASGKQVIVLVPEIALTTQLVHRFASRFKDVAVIHSGLSGVARSLTWNAIKTGSKRVIIGTRSAVFAPCQNLGLVVVDEEQEPSYKNQQTPRFHAREVAVQRARMLDIPIILGSATPSLETWFMAEKHEDYRAIHLSHRVSGQSLPRVDVVDMVHEEKVRRGHHLLSRQLEQRVHEALENKEQVVLLLNRRGYASTLYCPKCKSRVLCTRCQASMVVHRSTNQVVCHHCYAREAVPTHCADPSCAGGLIRLGVGTERVEEETLRKFPHARVQRVDSDTMRDVQSYHAMVSAFEKRQFDVMIGTQMVAKGLDFPYVSLVGVISADTGLFQPDFRANERTFQLVTQVSGRAGRAHTSGCVVVQTIMPDSPTLGFASQHDYDRFARYELQQRQKINMPPYSHLMRWVFSDPAESVARDGASQWTEIITQVIRGLGIENYAVLGPVPCPIERIRGLYRYDVVLRNETVSDRQHIINKLKTHPTRRIKVTRMTVDVDPESLL